MSVHHKIDKHLASLENYDKDERYMGTSDLCNLLQTDIKIDGATELRICTAILKRLDDASNDVQSKAIQCLGILLGKVQPAQVYEICDKLCTLLLDGKAELRDIYSIGLKTLVTDVPEESGRGVAERLIRRLLAGVNGDKLEVKLECLECLTDLMRRFGHEVAGEHRSVVSALLVQLAHEKKNVQKRATACMGASSVVLNEALLDELVTCLLTDAATPGKADVRVLITAIGQVSRCVGHRIGKHLGAIVPLFVQFLGDPVDEALQTEATNELRETCLQGFESFVLRCPLEIVPHLNVITNAAATFMRYDPNYCGDDDDEESGGEDEDFSDEDYDDEGGDDDDDTSWKVRRASVKVLAAAFQTAKTDQGVAELYATHGAAVVLRFKEREETVRIDVVECFTNLVAATALASGAASGAGGGLKGEERPGSPSGCGGEHQTGALAGLESVLPGAMAAAVRQLEKGKDEKTKSAVFALLRQLVGALPPAALAPYVDKMLSCVVSVLATPKASNALKLDALVFTRQALEALGGQAASLQPLVPTLLPHVLALVQGDWYKLIAEALRVVSAVVRVLRPMDQEGDMFEGSAQGGLSPQELEALVGPMHAAIQPRLEASDMDQEIKECAITAVGDLVASLGDLMLPQLPRVLSLLMDKLRNETTRMAALKALASIATSKLPQLDLTHILALGAVEELSLFLRQQSRPLLLATLETLLALVEAQGASMDPALLAKALAEAAPLVSDADLHLTHLALKLSSQILACSQASAPGQGPTGQGGQLQLAQALEGTVLPKALGLCASPLLQGRALSALLDLLRDLVKLNQPGTTFEDLYAAVRSRSEAGAPLPRAAVANVGLSLAALIVACAPDKAPDKAPFAATVQALLADLAPGGGLAEAGSASFQRQPLALRTLGEVGRHCDLSLVAPNLQQLLLASFDSEAEETKAAAAFALGSSAVGNMQVFLPSILQALAADRNHYLLLAALKEVITVHASEGRDFTPYLEAVLRPLSIECVSAEEGVRNMVAECLGALVTLHPDLLLPRLVAMAEKDPNDELMRWTVASALKYAMTGPSLLQSSLPALLPSFLALLADQDLGVKHASLMMCNAAVHHQPLLVKPALQETILPVLFETCKLKLERVVDLGPFKQKVDDALALRKASLATVNTILDVMPDQLDLPNFVNPLCSALSEGVADISLLSHQILAKICAHPKLFKGTVLASIDALAEPLRALADKLLKKKETSGTEAERNADHLRSCLRAFLALDGLAAEDPGSVALLSPNYKRLKEGVTSDERLRALVQVIQVEG